MKIAMVNAFFHPYQGGTEKYLLDLCTRLAKDHEVHVITSQLPDTEREEIYRGIKVHRLPSKVLKKLPKPVPPPYPVTPALTLQMKRKLSQIDPDVIHTHNRFFPAWNAPQLYRFLFKKPVVMTLHNARTVGIDKKTDLAGQFYDEVLGKRIMRKADILVANSKDTMEITAPPDIPEEKKKIVYNGIDTRQYHPTHEKDIRSELGVEKYTLTVCRLIKQKGLEYVVQALPEVEHDDYKHVVIGRGPEKKNLEKQARELGVEDKLHFTGFVPEEDMTDYYTQADAFVLPSLYEPFGIVLVEAMACETPVIATDAGGIPEVMGETGIPVPMRNSKRIAQGINRLLESPEEAEKMGKEGRKRAEEKFEWDKIAKDMEKVYREYLEGK